MGVFFVKEPSQYGVASIQPDGPVIAGSFGTWELRYTAGPAGVKEGGKIRIITDSDTDWGLPQFQNPEDPNYLSVNAPGGITAVTHVEDVRAMHITVLGRDLEKGEKIVVTYGDQSGGSKGSRVQTFQEDRKYFHLLVDPDGTGSFHQLEDSPYLKVTGGPIDHLRLIVPSIVRLGEPFSVFSKVEDEWGNPASQFQGRLELEGIPEMDLPEKTYDFRPGDEGVHTFLECVCSSEGSYRIKGSIEEEKVVAESNSFKCVATPKDHKLYWGDPHGGQVKMAEKIDDFFEYARDFAKIDFAGYQRNDHQISSEDWELQQSFERKYDEPGSFIPLPGFEWSEVTEVGGHHNIYFRRHGQPLRRSSHRGVDDTSDLGTDLGHIQEVYSHYRGRDVLLTPHVGGEEAYLDYHEPELEPLMEITSTHGTFEWFFKRALEKGYKMGVVGGSDGYTGRPGAEYPGYQQRRYAKGGLTALYAENLNLKDIFSALKSRRCYATTGARMLIELDVDGHTLGEEYSTPDPPEISATISGSAPIEFVELYRGTECIYREKFARNPESDQIRILWDGASKKASYSGVIWEGEITVEKGAILSCDKLRFDSPRSHISDMAEESLTWHSVTCGYPSGIILSLSEKEETRFHMNFHTSLISREEYGKSLFSKPGQPGKKRVNSAPAERLSLDFTASQVQDGLKDIEIGGVGRRVSISPAPECGESREIQFSYSDPSPRAGINPYWLKVQQVDLEMAWTSPVFLDYVE